MADLFMVKRQLKLSTWIVAFLFAGGVLASWNAWKKMELFNEGREQFVLFSLVSGMLAIAWVGLWVTYFFIGRFIQPERGKQVPGANIPWGMLSYISLLVFIGIMAFVLPRWSTRLENEFTLLEKGKLKHLAVLLSKEPGAAKQVDPKTGKTLLQWSVELGDSKALELLFAHGAQLEGTPNESEWLIQSLANPPMLKSLLLHGVDPNALDRANIAPIYYALSTHNTNALALLLEHGADVNIRNAQYQTPLKMAVLADDLAVVTRLVQHGASLNVWDQRGDTPLHLAVRRRNLEIVGFLLAHGADPEHFNFSDRCPLHMAALSGQDEMIERLLEVSKHVDVHNESDKTAFDHALRGRKYDTARLLIRHGANMDRVMGNGYTALHLMILAKEYRSARFLIEEGGDVRVADADGETVYDLLRRKQLESLLEQIDERDQPSSAEVPVVEGVSEP